MGADHRDFILIKTSLLTDPDFGMREGMTASELRELWGAWLFWILFFAEHGRLGGGIPYEKVRLAWIQKFKSFPKSGEVFESFEKFEEEFRSFEKFFEVLRSQGQVSRMRDKLRIRSFKHLQGSFSKRFGAVRKKRKDEEKKREREDEEKSSNSPCKSADQLQEFVAMAAAVSGEKPENWTPRIAASVAMIGYDLTRSAIRDTEAAKREGKIRKNAGAHLNDLLKRYQASSDSERGPP